MSNRFGSASSVLGSRRVQLAFIAVFIVLAACIACTKAFPLPFDEAHHFGLIQLYTHHLNPWLAGQPAGADSLGAVARDPSYLYHYLMSFPLRLISLFAHSTIQQVLALRLLNIGFGVTTLVLFRRFAIRLGVSVAMANLAMLGLAVTPVFYDLSGQVNYDNILIPLTLLTLIETLSITSVIRQGQVSIARLSRLFTLLLLTSLVKYSFLPIMAVVGAYLTVLIIRQKYKNSLHWDIKWRSWAAVLSIGMIIISGGLWVQRYGVNMVQYHTPKPQCNAVLSIQSCLQYGPWHRNYVLHSSYAEHPVAGLQLVNFTRVWLRSMYGGVYSIVRLQAHAPVFTPVTGTIQAAKYILAGSLLYGVLRWLRVRNFDRAWIFLGLVGCGYVLAVWIQNFRDFHHLGALVAIQGRYLLLIMPIVYALTGRVCTLLLQDIQSVRLRSVMSDLSTAWQNMRQALRLRTYP